MDGVFDDDGFYKTGDLARREGDEYYILGRASIDGETTLLCLAAP